MEMLHTPNTNEQIDRATQAARDTFESGVNTVAQNFKRVTDQFTHVLGVSGPQAEELARKGVAEHRGRFAGQQCPDERRPRDFARVV
jgi:hypothetical protein